MLHTGVYLYTYPFHRGLNITIFLSFSIRKSHESYLETGVELSNFYFLKSYTSVVPHFELLVIIHFQNHISGNTLFKELFVKGGPSMLFLPRRQEYFFPMKDIGRSHVTFKLLKIKIYLPE